MAAAGHKKTLTSTVTKKGHGSIKRARARWYYLRSWRSRGGVLRKYCGLEMCRESTRKGNKDNKDVEPHVVSVEQPYWVNRWRLRWRVCKNALKHPRLCNFFSGSVYWAPWQPISKAPIPTLKIQFDFRSFKHLLTLITEYRSRSSLGRGLT